MLGDPVQVVALSLLRSSNLGQNTLPSRRRPNTEFLQSALGEFNMCLAITACRFDLDLAGTRAEQCAEVFFYLAEGC